MDGPERLACDIGDIDGFSFHVLRSPRCAELGVAGPIGGAASERLPILGPCLLAPPWAASGRLDDVRATTLVRLGVEAAQGPNPAGTRVYCPVPTCPCNDPRRARGWASDASVKAHIHAHLAGLQGDVPNAWLQGRSRQRCMVCGLSVSIQHGVHPSGRACMHRVKGSNSCSGLRVLWRQPSGQEGSTGLTLEAFSGLLSGLRRPRCGC